MNKDDESSRDKKEGQDRIDSFLRLVPFFEFLLKCLELALKHFSNE